jgi:hypothetical protein
MPIVTGTGALSSGCRALQHSKRRPSDSAARRRRSIARDRARACMTSSSVAASMRALQIAARDAERVGQRSRIRRTSSPRLLERDDVVVDFDGAERLEIDAGAARRGAVHDARNVAAMLGADDEHVASVSFGDDLILQILRGVAPAGMTRASLSAAALLAQSIANRPQLRARIVHHLAGRIDLARVCAISCLNCARRR